MMLCRTCEILSSVSSCPPHPGPAVNPVGAQTGWKPRLLEQLREEDTADTSGGNPVRSLELHVGQSPSQQFKRCGSRLGCIFYTLLNHPFLKSQSKLNAKAHGQGDICLP